MAFHRLPQQEEMLNGLLKLDPLLISNCVGGWNVNPLLRITIRKNDSYLGEVRSVHGTAMRDWQELFPAVPIDPDTFIPLQGGEGYRVGGSPRLWLTPDRGRVVVDDRLFSELISVDAPRLNPGERIVMGQIREAGLASRSGRDLVLFLLRADIIRTYWHIEALLELVAETRTADAYAAEFTAVHTFFTSRRNDVRYAFTVTIEGMTGTIAVTGDEPGE